MLIGLSGYAGTGKDTLAELILRHNPAYLHFKFAGSLKQVAQEIYGWGPEHTDGALKEVVDPYWGISPREALQKIGTELFRETLPRVASPEYRRLTGDNIWVRSLIRKLRGYEYAVVSDVRYCNEAAAIVENGGVVVRIHRPGKTAGTHKSETELDNIPVTFSVYNDGTPEDLLAQFFSKLAERGGGV